MSDLSPYISTFQESELIFIFDLGKPFHPFTQLLGVLPKASSACLPAAYSRLMVAPDSPINDMYPEDFEIDMEGKKNSWEGLVLVPFIDEKKLTAAVNSVNTNLLSAQEKSQNSFGITRLYRFDPTMKPKQCVSSMPKLLRTLTQCFVRETTYELPLYKVDEHQLSSHASHFMHYDPSTIKLRDGFVSLLCWRSIYHGLSLKKKVNIFGYPSRQATLHLALINPANSSDDADEDEEVRGKSELDQDQPELMGPKPVSEYENYFCFKPSIANHLLATTKTTPAGQTIQWPPLPDKFYRMSYQSWEDLSELWNLLTLDNKDKLVWVDLPFLRLASLEGFLTEQFSSAGDNGSSEKRQVKKDMKFCRIQYQEKFGIDIGPVKVLVRVKKLSSMLHSSNGKITHVFSKEEETVPLQAVVPYFTYLTSQDGNIITNPTTKYLCNSDSRFDTKKTATKLRNLLKPGQAVLCTMPNTSAYGRPGKVLSAVDDKTAEVALVAPFAEFWSVEEHLARKANPQFSLYNKIRAKMSKPVFGWEISLKHMISWFSLSQLAAMLGLSAGVISQITGSCLINPGRMEGGLSLKFSGKQEQTVSYTRVRPTNPK